MRPGELLLDDKSRDGSHTLELAGELDIATAPDLEATIRSLCADGVGEIVLDLSKLEFVDSAGLRAILSGKALCEEHGCQLVMTHPREPVHRLFEVTGLLGRLRFRRRSADGHESPTPERHESPHT